MSTSFTIPQEISLIANSDPDSGAVNVSANGDRFEMNIYPPLIIPNNALNCNVVAEESTIWWTVPNISASIGNNRMYINGTPEAGGLTQQYIITIPDGLYDLGGLSTAVLRELQDAGAKVTPNPLINFTSDEATQRVGIIFNYTDVSIDFTPTDTPREILGFNSQVLGIYPNVPKTVLGDNVASFNTVNSFLIHSDLVAGGIPINGNYSSTISQVLIDVPAGSQIISQPRHPARINAENLTGRQVSRIRFWLTDEAGNPVDTNGEYWSTRIVIHYLKPMVATH